MHTYVGWYQSEYLALETCAAGSAISTAASFSANLVVAVSFLTELEQMTPSGAYGHYLGFIIVGLTLAYFCYPETEGLSVDEAFTLFDEDFGVKKSKEMRRKKIQMQDNYNIEGLETVNGEMDKSEAFHQETVDPVKLNGTEYKASG
ncbi:hypothetical protein N7462_006810 [Penicillium macrosclerotiorum]|uniref:uncharacterized protein n=1 Tax=Penicillium macrosclerotiorum TaxID=303699 RepID=UPI0025488EE6|nr:uncharacterized protein N7462_006810 [Penicillium macrosclerotiorum]KAJ5683645.1 hypothetical protein N7462_006810 [Penicillium macrosclerotiorum]